MKTEQLKDGPITHNYSSEMVTFASKVLVEYFKKFGAQTPGDMEDNFCGEPPAFEMFMNIQGRWRESPFYPALGHLVDKGIVRYWVDDNKVVWYNLCENLGNICENLGNEVEKQPTSTL